MTPAEQLSALARMAEKNPRTGLKAALQRLDEKIAVQDVCARLRAETSQKRTEKMKADMAGAMEGLS